MKNFSKNFRMVLVVLSTSCMIATQTVWAKGPGGGLASHSVSHASSSPSINTQFSSKSVKTQATNNSASTAINAGNSNTIKTTVPTNLSSQAHIASTVTDAKTSTAAAINKSTKFNPNQVSASSARTSATPVTMQTRDFFGLGDLLGNAASDLGQAAGVIYGLTLDTGGLPIFIYQLATTSSPVGTRTNMLKPPTDFAAAGRENRISNSVQFNSRNASAVDSTAGYENAIVGTTFFTPGKVATQSHMDVYNTTGIRGATQFKPETTGTVSHVIAAPTTININPPKNPTMPTHSPHPTGSVFGSGFGSDDSITNTTHSDAASTDTNSATVTTKAADVDLVLEDVTLASPASTDGGPAYTVKFRNQGSQAAGKFQVGIFAGLNKGLTDDAPRTVVEVPTLAAGDAQELTLRLPQSAMKMTSADGKLAAFTRLFVAVDVMNTVPETDESNNTAVIDRTALETTAN